MQYQELDSNFNLHDSKLNTSNHNKYYISKQMCPSFFNIAYS